MWHQDTWLFPAEDKANTGSHAVQRSLSCRWTLYAHPEGNGNAFGKRAKIQKTWKIYFTRAHVQVAEVNCCQFPLECGKQTRVTPSSVRTVRLSRPTRRGIEVPILCLRDSKLCDLLQLRGRYPIVLIFPYLSFCTWFIVFIELNQRFFSPLSFILPLCKIASLHIKCGLTFSSLFHNKSYHIPSYLIIIYLRTQGVTCQVSANTSVSLSTCYACPPPSPLRNKVGFLSMHGKISYPSANVSGSQNSKPFENARFVPIFLHSQSYPVFEPVLSKRDIFRRFLLDETVPRIEIKPSLFVL